MWYDHPFWKFLINQPVFHEMMEGSWALLNWDVKNTQRVVGYEIVGYIPPGSVGIVNLHDMVAYWTTHTTWHVSCAVDHCQPWTYLVDYVKGFLGISNSHNRCCFSLIGFKMLY